MDPVITRVAWICSIQFFNGAWYLIV